MNKLVAVLALFFASAVLAESGTPARRFSAGPRDLGAPGALEALEASNPDHYRRVSELIAIASTLRCAGSKLVPLGH